MSTGTAPSAAAHRHRSIVEVAGAVSRSGPKRPSKLGDGAVDPFPVRLAAFARGPASRRLPCRGISPHLKETLMKRYVIEREVPGIGMLSGAQLKDAASTSNAALDQLGGKVQWLHSYVTDDKTFCVYLAESEDQVQEHARLSGFPANKVTEVHSILEPMTAF